MANIKNFTNSFTENSMEFGNMGKELNGLILPMKIMIKNKKI